jgi:hypothetical protein
MQMHWSEQAREQGREQAEVHRFRQHAGRLVATFINDHGEGAAVRLLDSKHLEFANRPDLAQRRQLAQSFQQPPQHGPQGNNPTARRR